MKDNESVLEADLDYAARMVIKGYASAEDAARACGVNVADLKARLALVQPPFPGSGQAMR